MWTDGGHDRIPEGTVEYRACVIRRMVGVG